ncbi:WbqC-like protein family protein [Rheinheimera pacifica]|uniref:WbqC-like protein family protein n=1 Tax=Rheinheimera pacifica TaxID=173990 RepID=A0A1H6MMZ7_9GAMM|nr:WbqC family protein [Rheinheimera pacifica]SEH99030.1 WbqC-like protein family protein [Rheinheimera pacifica]
MKLAVMQPYLFPYLGYYQLAFCADVFVFYDDVTYIKGGYINRNAILSQNKAQRFTIPVPGASSNVLIKDLDFSPDVRKVLSSIQQAYSKSPFFADVYPIVEKVLTQPSRNVADLCRNSIATVFEYLGINKQFHFSSQLSYDRTLSPAGKLVQMCKLFQCDEYINSPGGRNLYSGNDFLYHDITLNFIKMNEKKYLQSGSVDFTPNLSIIDLLMNCSKCDVIDMFESYTLES